MTVTSEWIYTVEEQESICEEVITSKVVDNSFLKMKICKDKDSDKYDSYLFTNQNGDSFICKSDEFIELYNYFKTNGIGLKMYNGKYKDDNN